jgi:hypothetical protein
MTSPVLRSHPTVGAARRCGVAMLALCLGVGAAETALAGQRQQQIPRTSAEANGDSLGSAMAAPLRDINVVRSDIPDLLTKAQTDPYAPPTPGCAPLKAEIAQFDAVLGDDYDNRKDAKDEGAMSRPVLGVVASTITDVIPMRGWVRRLTGAERHLTPHEDVAQPLRAGLGDLAPVFAVVQGLGLVAPGIEQLQPVDLEGRRCRGWSGSARAPGPWRPAGRRGRRSAAAGPRRTTAASTGRIRPSKAGRPGRSARSAGPGPPPCPCARPAPRRSPAPAG